ncbi:MULTISPECIES: hypothetical protein [Streptomyces]|uniref:Uncharacterized protein n=1 Tax=Streptomyces galilaeus TaxID=33899 RepID=A0ABW9IKX8_STRGJ
MVTLDKTPRPFLALVQDGAVVAVNADSDATREAHDVAALNDCYDVHEVTAIDRFDAHTQVTDSLNGVITLAELKAICMGTDA